MAWFGVIASPPEPREEINLGVVVGESDGAAAVSAVDGVDLLAQENSTYRRNLRFEKVTCRLATGV